MEIDASEPALRLIARRGGRLYVWFADLGKSPGSLTPASRGAAPARGVIQNRVTNREHRSSTSLTNAPAGTTNTDANWGSQSLTLRADGTFPLRNLRFPVTTQDGAPVKGSFRVLGPGLDLIPGATTPAPEGGGETWR
jgi:hypothetical protein